MKRPSFQFYPADWQANSNLRRCTHEEKGIWIDVMCLLHDQEEYGVSRWPLKEIAQAVGCSVAKLKGLVAKGVIKGADTGDLCDSLIYVPRSGRKNGPEVTLIEKQEGPVWYSSRMVVDEYKRILRGELGATPKATPDHSPKGGIGATPKATPDHSPSRARASSSSSSSSSVNPKDKTSSSTAQPLPGEIQPSDAATIPDPPSNPSHWLQWFNATQGLCLDPTSIHDRKKFWPLATEWCKAQVPISLMQSAIAKARSESSEPIVFMPAYVDRILATQNAPPPQRTAAAEVTLAAARTIFGDEHEYRSGTVIDGTAITLGGDGQEDFPRIAG